ncbi:MAG: carbohydrate ABC transporter permease, partial [Pseudomonadota bacterium]
MTAEATDVAAPDTRKAGRAVYISAVVLLCAWVLVPLYFLLINTLSSPDTVNSFPKPAFPEFDLGSLTFFANFAGMLTALKNSILVAGLTMIMSIVVGAPAGYALSRFDFRGKELFRL